MKGIVRDGHHYMRFRIGIKGDSRTSIIERIDQIPEHDAHHKWVEGGPIYVCIGECECLCDHCVIWRVAGANNKSVVEG